MPTVAAVLLRVKSLDIEKEALVAISNTAREYLDLNREQLMHGTRADGSKMPNYSRASVEVYGKPAGPIRLYDTGAFQSSFKLDVDSAGLHVVAEDKYGLAEKYSDEIYGLGKSQQQHYNQEVFLPKLMESVHHATGL